MKYLITTMILLGILKAEAKDLETVEAKYRGKPIIQMKINNKDTWVLLDTGSDCTVLDSESSQKFNFYMNHASSEGKNVAGLGSSNNHLKKVTGASIHFGHVKLKGPLYAYDLTSVAKSIQLRTGKRISAIIGTHMMKAYGFVIDMRSNTATLHVKPKKKSRLQENSEEVVIAKHLESTR